MPRRAPYLIGRNAECLILEKLKAMGYRYAIRSAGSHGATDILCANEAGERLAIQVKKSKGLSSDERSKFLDWAKVFGAKAVLARRRGLQWVLEVLAGEGPRASCLKL